ncbi:hypothetical protein HTG_05295 [Natrinema mahii]|nr:hypothetical protein HTG_05295 [Natrinema mahii]
MLSESEPFYEGSAEPRRGNSPSSRPLEDEVFQDSADESSGQRPRDHEGEFRVELPDDIRDRVGPVADHEQFDAVLETLVDRIEAELRKQFEFDETE